MRFSTETQNKNLVRLFENLLWSVEIQEEDQLVKDKVIIKQNSKGPNDTRAKW